TGRLVQPSGRSRRRCRGGGGQRQCGGSLRRRLQADVDVERNGSDSSCSESVGGSTGGAIRPTSSGSPKEAMVGGHDPGHPVQRPAPLFGHVYAAAAVPQVAPVIVVQPGCGGGGGGAPPSPAAAAT
ncbi:hypothetical protein KR018_009435, partial [Drosophila ironensis]